MTTSELLSLFASLEGMDDHKEKLLTRNLELGIDNKQQAVKKKIAKWSEIRTTMLKLLPFRASLLDSEGDKENPFLCNLNPFIESH